MTIGEKLKAARGGAGMTQEQAAQRLQVSRQTVSNWENDRSYPDIAGVLALAKLYGLSLDELLREDEGMLRHLEESTNIVKSKRTLSRRLLMAAYLVIWGVSIAFFWVGTAPTDAMGYGLVFLWFLIPVATMVVAFFVATPVFLSANTSIKMAWIGWHPFYHVYMGLKNAFFGMPVTSPVYYICAACAIILLFGIVDAAFCKEMGR